MTALDHDTRRPLLLAALAVAAALTMAACGKEGAKAPTAAATKPSDKEGAKKEEGHKEGDEALMLTKEEAERAGIKVEAIQAQAMAETVVVTATIRPDQDRLARVAPRIEGRITAAPAKLGDRVRAGQTLATLDSVEVAEAHAAWSQAQADSRIAEADFKRAEQLDAEEIIPRKDFLRAQADREKAVTALRTATDKLRLLGGRPGGGASGFAVGAPFAGTVIEKKATLGDLATPSEPMFTIADLSRVWIQADLPEAALAKVRVGAEAKVSVSAYRGETFAGRVTYIGAALERDTRTVAARIEVPNADGRLKPEMFATASIDVSAEAGGKSAEVIALPDAAVVLMQGQPNVFVLEAGNYEMRAVETGERSGGRVVITAGLEAGDQVVTAGAYALKARKLKSQLGEGH